ncbi:MAG: hypothetical protein NTZ48_07715 [Candidatus Omnitrophica bacterium]|nr:hypothetical protein [Candidatus Omnitrophota bacterium]
MRPLILDFAIARTGEAKVLYEYDPGRSLNIVRVNNKDIPFIVAGIEELSLLTKTKVHQERDDDSISLELLTKTRVDREKDDDHQSLLELKTKTLVNNERDDEHPSYFQ